MWLVPSTAAAALVLTVMMMVCENDNYFSLVVSVDVVGWQASFVRIFIKFSGMSYTWMDGWVDGIFVLVDSIIVSSSSSSSRKRRRMRGVVVRNWTAVQRTMESLEDFQRDSSFDDWWSMMTAFY